MDIDDLMHKIKIGNLDGVKKAISEGFDVNQQDGNFYTPLIFASENGYDEVVDLLLQANADTEVKFEFFNDKTIKRVFGDGETALMKAVWNGHFDIVKNLVKYGANVNCVNREEECTALMHAVIRDRNEILEFLLDAGANVNAKTNRAATALMYAIKRSNFKGAELLLSRAPDIHVKNSEGDNVLMMASASNQINMVKRLIELGADVNSQDNKGNTALMVMANELWFKNQSEVLELLLNTNIDIAIKNDYDQTALDIARGNNRGDWASMVESRILAKEISAKNSPIQGLEF